MLYVTTRDNRDAFTAHRALTEDRAPDGGLYVPFRLPYFENDRICSLRELSMGERIAQILSLFFPVQLSGWDVDFCIGRNPLKISPINHKILIAETWHNPESDYAYIECSLYRKLCIDHICEGIPSDWSKIAIRIAVLCSILCELPDLEDYPIDVAVDVADVTAFAAVWYIRQMGFPVSTIVCGCDENSPYSELFRRGVISGSVMLNGSLPINLERLVYTMFGATEAKRYLDVRNCGKSYTVAEDARDRIFFAVVGNSRIHSLVDGIRKTSAYTMDSCTAIAFGALQDYRATNRENRYTVLFADKRPVSGSN